MSNIADFPALSFACPQLWAQMQGNEKTRFCDVCQKNVHNLSMMNAEERQALRAETGESPCVAYFRHVNGTPVDVTALPEENPLKKILTQAAMVSLGGVALGSIAVSSMKLGEAFGKDQEAPTTSTTMAQYHMLAGVACPYPENIPLRPADKVKPQGPGVGPPPMPTPLGSPFGSPGGLPPSVLQQ